MKIQWEAQDPRDSKAAVAGMDTTMGRQLSAVLWKAFLIQDHASPQGGPYPVPHQQGGVKGQAW